MKPLNFNSSAESSLRTSQGNKSEQGQTWNSVSLIATDHLTPSSSQPRTYFDEEAIANLAQSIQFFGILQPLIVRPISHDRFEIIAGERRWRAAKLLGHKTVPCLVRNQNENDDLEIALIENLQRQDLTPIEEAQALADLIENHHYTHDELGLRVGLPRTSISNSLRLLQLPDSVKILVHNGQLSAGHAKAILTLESQNEQIKLAKIASEKGLSVRKTEELARILARANKQPESSGEPLLNANLRHLCDQYKGHLGTKVKIMGDLERGRIEISYYSHEDLDRITELVLGDLTTQKS